MIKIIAEIGWNHMGDMNLAEKMIKAASNAGADFAKFQTWSVKYLKPGPWDHDGRLEIYKQAELNEDKHQYLKQVCEANNINLITNKQIRTMGLKNKTAGAHKKVDNLPPNPKEIVKKVKLILNEK